MSVYIRSSFLICILHILKGANLMNVSAQSMESQLFNDLMASYNPNVRPVNTPTDVLGVGFIFFLSKMEELNEPEQTLSTSGCAGLIWNDVHLTWNPANYGGVTEIVFPAKHIWRPEFTLFNGKYGTSDVGLRESVRVRVSPNGEILLVLCEKYETTCTVDLEMFPHDTQRCSLEFTYWLYPENKVFINNTAPTVSLEAYLENGEWNLTTTSMSRLSSAENTASQLPILYVNLTFERVPTYFYSTIIVPTLTFTFCSLMVFLLPAEAGEKISLGVTIMLSFTIVLLLVTNVSPKTGKMPRITLYIIAMMVLNAIAVIFEVIVLKFYFHQGNKPLPKTLRKIILQGIGRIVCYRHKPAGDSVVPMTNAIAVEEMSVDDEKKKIPGTDAFADLMAYVKDRQEKFKEDEKQEAILAEWKAASIILDRFLCIVSFIVVTFSTLGLLTSLNTGVPI